MAAESTTINKVKAWASPVLFSGIAFIFWQGITEMKTDIKKLLAESEYRRAKEEQMEKDITDLKNVVYYNKKNISASSSYDMKKKGERTEKKMPVYYVNERMYHFKRRFVPELEA